MKKTAVVLTVLLAIWIVAPVSLLKAVEQRKGPPIPRPDHRRGLRRGHCCLRGAFGKAGSYPHRCEALRATGSRRQIRAAMLLVSFS